MSGNVFRDIKSVQSIYTKQQYLTNGFVGTVFFSLAGCKNGIANPQGDAQYEHKVTLHSITPFHRKIR
jgi:hypothetical protein